MALLLFVAACGSNGDGEGEEPDAGQPDVLIIGDNACGGEGALEMDGDSVAPGDDCGPCDDGVVVCDGVDEVRCVQATEPNECGGCEPLHAEEGDLCGPCEDGAYQCSDGGLECVGAGDLNACGGCSELDGTPNHICEDGAEEGVLGCTGPDSLRCVLPGENACGGVTELAEEPGTFCGPCDGGVVACVDDDETICSNEDRGVNDCGGCQQLPGMVDNLCGGCDGSFVCDGENGLTCQGGTGNACGGCAELDSFPGEQCDGASVYICESPDSLTCPDDETNACGGMDPLGGAPLDECGPCDDGVLICASPNDLVCTGESATNACGGCASLAGQPGESCEGGDGEWECDGDNQLVCEAGNGDDPELSHANPGCDSSSTSCALSAGVDEDLELSVKLASNDGSAVTDALISFELEAITGAEGAQLTATSVLTEDEGIATAILETGEAMGTVEVTASAADLPDINPVTFNIGISAEGGAAYLIEFSHDGESQPDRVQPFLLDSQVDCEEATSHYLQNGTWPPFGAVALSYVDVLPDGTIIQAMYPAANDGDSFTVVGAAEESIGGEDVHVAYGCNDDAEVVQGGEDMVVAVSLVDHLPHFEQRYDVNHDFELSGAIPQSVQTVIGMLSKFADSPMEFIFGCPSAISGCDDSTGLVDLLFEFGYITDSEIIADIEGLRTDGTHYSAGSDFLDSLMADHEAGGTLPSWVFDSSTLESELTDLFDAVSVQGSIFIDEQPDVVFDEGTPVGLIGPDSASQRWDEFIFQWSLGCAGTADPETCAENAVLASELGDVVTGEFGAIVQGPNTIELEEHSMSLDYGGFLIGAIEQVALPNMVDESVLSVGDLFEELISCSDLADVYSESGDLHTSVMTTCLAIIDNATDMIGDYVGEEVVSDGDHIRLSTSADTPCSIQQPDSYQGTWPGSPFPTISTIGRPDDQTRCQWDVEIDFSDDGETDAATSGFFDGSLP